MKISVKITILLLSLVILSLTVFAAIFIFERHRVAFVLSEQEQALTKTFDKSLELIGRSLYTFLYDYTWWDEMVHFVREDLDKIYGYESISGWGKSNLTDSLDTFDANGVWVYNLDLKLVHSANNLDDEVLRELPVPKESISALFGNDGRFCHFYTYIPEGLMEVRGATVHRENDAEREGAPHGYMFAGRLWGRKHLARISEFTGTDIMITPLGGSSGTGENPTGRKGSVIAISKSLSGWDGEPVARINIWKESLVFKEFGRVFRVLFLAFLVYWIVVIVSLLIFLGLWITRPLYIISRTLETEEGGKLDPLLEEKAEFGRIARLVKNFFTQRETLVKEMLQREKAEENAKRKIEALEHYKKLTVDREGRMIELKDEIRRLSAELARLRRGRE